jgi:hypothetical protein
LISVFSRGSCLKTNSWNEQQKKFIAYAIQLRGWIVAVKNLGHQYDKLLINDLLI